jgi:cytoskeleton protein RodZ
MPEIGASLRDARMRQRIDISEIEAQTKIRAKYLRALENEEWDLIPGTTFVKSFLRTYADALGLDSRALLEEYKLRYELADSELLPIAPQSARERARARRTRRPSARRDVIVAACVVGLVALLIVLGRGGGDGSSPPTRESRTNAGSTTTTASHGSTTTEKPAKPKRVRLGLHPTGLVYVCLQAGGRLVIDKQTFTATTPIRIYRASSFRILLGNNRLTLTIDGKQWTPAPSSVPIAYSITAKGRHPITADAAALCT